MVDSPTESHDGLEHYESPGGKEIEPTILFPARETKLEKKTNQIKYTDMVEIALYHLNQRSGSSRQAVVKYILANFEVSEKRVNHYVGLALVRLVANEQVSDNSDFTPKRERERIRSIEIILNCVFSFFTV